MLAQACLVALMLLALGVLCCVYRFLRGPSLPDRVLALDTLSVLVLAQFIVLGVYYDTRLYFEAGLLIALLGFLSTVAVAKFLLRGGVLE
ncbi:Na(+)/H(+) antiporter subunit F [bacterium HR17]|uniref:Na(+)/H(+) antiporter subunit F n=1 Tax=Candidatus Fervidibacter japonicus TaxID=2035412 RepID=A0A2H5X9I4_9BACT|nr:Na(+)/H(+) antiporter subunit F [bacterium HR17]